MIYAYCRVSTTHQTEENQHFAIEQFATFTMPAQSSLCVIFPSIRVFLIVRHHSKLFWEYCQTILAKQELDIEKPMILYLVAPPLRFEFLPETDPNPTVVQIISQKHEKTNNHNY